MKAKSPSRHVNMLRKNLVLFNFQQLRCASNENFKTKFLQLKLKRNKIKWKATLFFKAVRLRSYFYIFDVVIWLLSFALKQNKNHNENDDYSSAIEVTVIIKDLY